MLQSNLVEIRIPKKFSVSFYILGCQLNEISSSPGLNVATGTSARCRSNAELLKKRPVYKYFDYMQII